MTIGYKALLILLSALPALLIAYWIYQLDKYERERRRPLIICFLLGALLPLIILLLQRSLYDQFAIRNGAWWSPVIMAFLLIALTEEAAKLLALSIYPIRLPFFNEPMDGIVYAIMIAMGFATVENVLYATRYGLPTLVIRAFSAVPAHACFAIMMGYCAGAAKFSKYPRRWWCLAFLIPWLVHGFYNLFIIQDTYDWLTGMAVVLLGISVVVAGKLIKRHQQKSPFRRSE